MTATEQTTGPPQPATENLLVRTEAASRYFKVGDSEVHAVDGVTFEMPHGKLYALRGRSGSGKTTLLNLVGALDKPTAGQVFFDGNNLGKMSDRNLTLLRRHRMGFVFQTFALLPVLSAFENVELTLRIAGKSARERRDRTNEVLSMVGLEHRADHRSFELSGGEQQRVSIARAIANKPSLLIADEPTGELDSVTGLEIMLLFRSIVDNDGISILMATHDPALSQFADDTFLLEDGRLSHAEGPLDFDLPDLVQHIEFGEIPRSDSSEPEAIQSEAPAEVEPQTATVEDAPAEEEPRTATVEDAPATDSDGPPARASEPDDSLFRPKP